MSGNAGLVVSLGAINFHLSDWSGGDSFPQVDMSKFDISKLLWFSGGLVNKDLSVVFTWSVYKGAISSWIGLYISFMNFSK